MRPLGDLLVEVWIRAWRLLWIDLPVACVWKLVQDFSGVEAHSVAMFSSLGSLVGPQNLHVLLLLLQLPFFLATLFATELNYVEGVP